MARRPPSAYFISKAKTNDEKAIGALLGAKIQGCDCYPEIRLRREPIVPGADEFDIFHDDWCSLWMSAQGEDN